MFIISTNVFKSCAFTHQRFDLFPRVKALTNAIRDETRRREGLGLIFPMISRSYVASESFWERQQDC